MLLMNRRCGLALDKTVKNNIFSVIWMLLEHGANPKYSRLLHKAVLLRHHRKQPNSEGAWRPLMEMLLHYSADVEAVTYYGGNAITFAPRSRCGVS